MRDHLPSFPLPGRRLANGLQPALAIRAIGHDINTPANKPDGISNTFAQSSAARTGAGGTGLGLAICQAIAQQHRGTIVATNNDRSGASSPRPCRYIPAWIDAVIT